MSLRVASWEIARCHHAGGTPVPPSTEPPAGQSSTGAERGFAARILQELLHRIEVRNANAIAYPRLGRCIFLVSHAWTDGSSIRLVYTTPP